jgi:hypothetical protein
MRRFAEWQKELLGLGAGAGVIYLVLATVAALLVLRMMLGN